MIRKAFLFVCWIVEVVAAGHVMRFVAGGMALGLTIDMGFDAGHGWPIHPVFAGAIAGSVFGVALGLRRMAGLPNRWR